MVFHVCRICLVSDVKMYSFQKESLKSCLETIGLFKVNNLEWKLPETICFECAAILLKYAELQAKCIKSKSILIVILEFYKQITRESMRNVDREELKLKSKLGIHHVDLEAILKIEHHEDDSVNKTEVADDDQIDVKSESIDDVKSESIDDVFDQDGELLMGCDSEDVKPQIEENKNLSKVFVDIPVTDPLCIRGNKKNKIINIVYMPTRKKRNSGNKKANSLLQKVPSEKQTQMEPKATKRETYYDKIKSNFDIVDLSLEEQIEELEKRKCSQYYINAPYKCDKCYKFFIKSEPYIKHLAQHDPINGDEECPVCKKRFHSAQVCRVHVVINHERQYRCKQCPALCKQRTIHDHMTTHLRDIQPYRCNHCDFVTNTQWKYQSHRRRAHGRRYSCVHCGNSFISERGLQLHRVKGHALPEDAEEEIITEHACVECDIMFATESALKVHLATSRRHNEKKISEGIVCVRCGDHFETKQQLSQHKLDKHNKRFDFPRQCLHCDQMIYSRSEHWSHNRSQHPHQRKSYRSLLQQSLCEVCGRSFKSVTDLRMHSYRHQGAPTLSCPERGCSMRLYDAYQLRSHVRNVHTAARPFQCDICSLSFKLKSNLVRHMVVHTGVRPYPCALCDKAFTQSGSRELHVRTVHYNQPHPPRTRRSKNNAASEKKPK